MNKKIVSLSIKPTVLGLKSGGISRKAFQQITVALQKQNMSIKDSRQLANTFLRLTPDSIDLLVKWNVFSEQEADILKTADYAAITSMIEGNFYPNFILNIKKLLDGYDSSPLIKKEVFSAQRKTIVLSRLIPVSEIEKLTNKGVPFDIVFKILRYRFNLISQIEQAILFAKEHQAEMNGSYFAWMFLITHGFENGKALFEESMLFLKDNARYFVNQKDSGKNAGWTFICYYGLEAAKKVVKDMITLKQLSTN